jgi:hypothetical protein
MDTGAFGVPRDAALIVCLLLLLASGVAAGCASTTPTTTLATSPASSLPTVSTIPAATESSATPEEQTFMSQLYPDFVAYVRLITQGTAGEMTDQAVHRELQQLLERWNDRKAPSAKIQAFLSGWLIDLRSCEKYWALLADGDTAGARAMRSEVDKAINGENLPETFFGLAGDLGLPRIGLESTSTS